jgi:hypothetical protein
MVENAGQGFNNVIHQLENIVGVDFKWEAVGDILKRSGGTIGAQQIENAILETAKQQYANDIQKYESIKEQVRARFLEAEKHRELTGLDLDNNRKRIDAWIAKITGVSNVNFQKAQTNKLNRETEYIGREKEAAIDLTKMQSFQIFASSASSMMSTLMIPLMFGGLANLMEGKGFQVDGKNPFETLLHLPIFQTLMNAGSPTAINAGTSPNGNTQAVAKDKNPLDNKDFMAIDPKYDNALKAALKGNTKDLMAIQNGTKGHQLTFLDFGNNIVRMIDNKTLIEKYDVKPDSKSPNAKIMQNGKWVGVDITQKANETATAPSVVKKTAAVVTEAVTPKAKPEENQPIPLRQLPQLQMQKPA